LQAARRSPKAVLGVCNDNFKKRKEKFTLFSDHNGSLLRRQPREEQLERYIKDTVDVPYYKPG